MERLEVRKDQSISIVRVTGAVWLFGGRRGGFRERVGERISRIVELSGKGRGRRRDGLTMCKMRGKRLVEGKFSETEMLKAHIGAQSLYPEIYFSRKFR